MHVRWTEQAKQDLIELVAHIAQDDPGAARRMSARIRHVVNELKQFPQTGPIVPEFGVNSIRERIVPPYRLVYLLDREVYVLAVHHSRRLLPPEPDLLERAESED